MDPTWIVVLIIFVLFIVGLVFIMRGFLDTGKTKHREIYDGGVSDWVTNEYLPRFPKENQANANQQFYAVDPAHESLMEEIISRQRKSLFNLETFRDTLDEDDEEFQKFIEEYTENKISWDPFKYVSAYNLMHHSKIRLQNIANQFPHAKPYIDMLLVEGETYPFYRKASVDAYKIMSGMIDTPFEIVSESAHESSPTTTYYSPQRQNEPESEPGNETTSVFVVEPPRMYSQYQGQGVELTTYR